MTYLELCQRLVLEARIGSSGPVTVADQAGDYANAVRWIQNSWSRIQSNRKLWSWMRREFRIALVEDQKVYTFEDAIDVDEGNTIARFNDWFLTKSSERPYGRERGAERVTKRYAQFVPWETWRQLDYDVGTTKSASPSYFTIDPQNRLRVYPIPNGSDYDWYGEYRRAPQVLELDEDVPEGIDESLHEVIVWQAMVYYGYNYVAEELLEMAADQIVPLMQQMRRDYLPKARSSGSTLV